MVYWAGWHGLGVKAKCWALTRQTTVAAGPKTGFQMTFRTSASLAWITPRHCRTGKAVARKTGTVDNVCALYLLHVGIAPYL